MSLRRSHSTQSPRSDDDKARQNDIHHEHSREDVHEHDHDHTHTHSHSIFHAHSHDEGVEGAEKLIEAFRGGRDRGSQITLIGLASNVALTAAKGTAGWYMHSASLLAEAGHSLSDLLGDFVTLFCWRLSRKPPSERYPYGFAKFETLGTTTVSLLLIGGALGIGFHSYHLLIEALDHTVTTLPPGMLQDALQNVTAAAQHVPTVGHGHGHAHGNLLDPNAAWFAAVSVIAKEWLYRVTKKVADEERSPVLLANAIHHRSDAYTSLVALFAILGTWWFPALPLDPIGGVLVSILILRQSWGVLTGSFRDLTDAGVSRNTQRSLTRALEPLITSSLTLSTPPLSSTVEPSSSLDGPLPHLLAIRHLRAKRAGSRLFVDLTADVSPVLTVSETSGIEARITQVLQKARKEIAEVRVQFNPVDNEHS